MCSQAEQRLGLIRFHKVDKNVRAFLSQIVCTIFLELNAYFNNAFVSLWLRLNRFDRTGCEPAGIQVVPIIFPI